MPMYTPLVIRSPNAYAEGGLTDAADAVSGAGRGGDSVLLHVAPEELEWLRSMWGDPTVNPDTGLPEYFKIKDVIKKALPYVTAALPVVFPGVGNAIGEALGAGSAWAGPLGNALIGGASGALTGGGEGAARGALTSGVLSAVTDMLDSGTSSKQEAVREADAGENPSWLRRNALPVGASALGALALAGGSRRAEMPASTAPALPSSFTDPLPQLDFEREPESDEDYDNIDWATYGQRAPRSFFRNNYLPRDNAPSTGYFDGGVVEGYWEGGDVDADAANAAVEASLAAEAAATEGDGPSYTDPGWADSMAANYGIQTDNGVVGVPGGTVGSTDANPNGPEGGYYGDPVYSAPAPAPQRGGVLGYLKKAAKDAVQNPVRTGIDLLASGTVLGVPNVIAKGLTGESIGSLVMGLGRGIGDALGLNDAKAENMNYTGPQWSEAMPTNYGYAPNESGDPGSGPSFDVSALGSDKSGSAEPGTGSGSFQPVGAPQPSPLSYISRTAGFEDPSYYYTYGSKPQKSFYARGGRNRGEGTLSQEPRYFAQGEGSGRIDNIHAALSPKEYVMDAETVAMLGDGNPDEGAKKLDDMRSKLRKHKGKALAKGKFSPNAKSPLSYLAGRA